MEQLEDFQRLIELDEENRAFDDGYHDNLKAVAQTFLLEEQNQLLADVSHCEQLENEYKKLIKDRSVAAKRKYNNYLGNFKGIVFNRSCTNTNRKCHKDGTFQIDFQDLIHDPQMFHDSLCGCENFIKRSDLIQNKTPIFVLDHERGEAWYGLTQTVEYIQDGPYYGNLSNKQKRHLKISIDASGNIPCIILPMGPVDERFIFSFLSDTEHEFLSELIKIFPFHGTRAEFRQNGLPDTIFHSYFRVKDYLDTLVFSKMCDFHMFYDKKTKTNWYDTTDESDNDDDCTTPSTKHDSDDESM
jgi:hypothetical protein